MGVGDDSTRKDLFIYIQSSLASLARSFIARGSVQEISDDRPRERSERGENFGDEGVERAWFGVVSARLRHLGKVGASDII